MGKNGSLNSKIWDSKIIDEVILKGMTIDNLGRHLGLYKHLREENSTLEYIIYEVRMQRSG